MPFIAACLRKLAEWRAFFTLKISVFLLTQPKLLTHSGHGSVLILHLYIPPGRVVSSSIARATIRRITSAPCFGRLRQSACSRCHKCGLATGSHESLERHVVRCPNGGMRHLMHDGLVRVFVSIFKDVGIPDTAVVKDARGLRAADASRPGNVVDLDLFAEGRPDLFVTFTPTVDDTARTALPQELRLALIHHKKCFFKGGLTLHVVSSIPVSPDYVPLSGCARHPCSPIPDGHGAYASRTTPTWLGRFGRYSPPEPRAMAPSPITQDARGPPRGLPPPSLAPTFLHRRGRHHHIEVR